MNVNDFIPKYIRQVLSNVPKQAVTADRWNELWNLAITQGDYNTEAIDAIILDYLITRDLAEGLLTSYNAHAANTNNPHAVNKAQLGLGFVDDTTDMNKPVSYLQQAALNLKADKATTYTKAELDPILRNGDTLIKIEVFTIVSTDNGDDTFTYSDSDGAQHFGALSAEGYQTFTLAKGTYTPGENRIEAIINDTLVRSVASGGLVEPNSYSIQLTTPQGIGAEISIKYFERLGLAGEHAITHAEGGDDPITPAAIGAATDDHTHDYIAHKTAHSTGGVDALTPANIGAAVAGHTHNYLPLTGGALSGPLITSVPAGATYKNLLQLGSYGNVSCYAGGAILVVAMNAYIDNAGNFKYSQTHTGAGARGFIFKYNVNKIYTFDTGIIATTADAIFTPTLREVMDSTTINNYGTLTFSGTLGTDGSNNTTNFEDYPNFEWVGDIVVAPTDASHVINLTQINTSWYSAGYNGTITIKASYRFGTGAEIFLPEQTLTVNDTLLITPYTYNLNVKGSIGETLYISFYSTNNSAGGHKFQEGSAIGRQLRAMNLTPLLS